MKTKIFDANNLLFFQDKINNIKTYYDLGIIFFSGNFDSSALYEIGIQKTKNIIVFSTAGCFCKDNIRNNNISCILLKLPKDSYKIKIFEYEKTNYLKTAKKIGLYAKKSFSNANALFFGSQKADLNLNIDKLLSTYIEASNNKVDTFGGFSGQKSENFSGISIGTNNIFSQNAIILLSFNKNKILLKGKPFSGWKKIGAEKIVTKAISNRVYEIDNIPIYNFYKNYIELSENDFYRKIIQFPLIIKQNNGSEIIRGSFDFNKEYFSFSQAIPIGSKVFLSLPNIIGALKKLFLNLDSFQEKNNLKNADCAILFSCAARKYTFDFFLEKENKIFSKAWNNNYIGAFCFAEIAKNDNNTSLQNFSLSTIYLKDLTSNKNNNNFNKILEDKTDIEKEFLENLDDIKTDKNKLILDTYKEKIILNKLIHNISIELNNTLNELNEYKNNLEDKINKQIGKISSLNKEIINTQKEVIFTLGGICEVRSQETAFHVRRVAKYSEFFAKKIGLNKKEINLIKLASPMHDIGKLGIPDSILKKRTKLTKKEFKIIKTHTNLGYNMLKHSKKDILKAAAIIAYTHHERWDGKGYPNNLKGEEIHIFGRITAIADVFDALGSKRSYKKAWEDKKIFNLIEYESGRKFDPLLVDIFLKNKHKFLKIRNKYKD